MMSQPKMEKKKLTLVENIKVIQIYKRVGVGYRGIAQDLGAGKTQIHNIIKSKHEHI